MINSEILQDAVSRLFECADCATYSRSEIANGYYLKMSTRYHPSEWYVSLMKVTNDIEEKIKDFYLLGYYESLYYLFKGESDIIDYLTNDIEEEIQREASNSDLS